MHGVARCCTVLHCVAVRCTVLHCVTACCSVLQRAAVCCINRFHIVSRLLQMEYIDVLCCSVLQRDAVCCINRCPIHFWATCRGWQRCIESLMLQVSFRKRASNDRFLLRKMTCKDKAFCASSPLCSCSLCCSVL